MKPGATIQRILIPALSILLALTMLTIPGSTKAQSEVVIETLRVDIWPEYDQPAVLVIYHITLSAETQLPADMSIRIPAAVGSPHAVAWQDANGLYNLSYKEVPAGDWTELQFNTSFPDIRIEYYDPGISKKETGRSYTFNWPGDITVNNLSLMIQQPAGATNMIVKPSMGSGNQADDGLTYFTYMAGKVPLGSTFSISLGYDKEDDTLTSASQFQPVEPSVPVRENTAGRINWAQLLPWTLGGLFLLLGAAALFYYFGPRRSLQSSPSRHRHGRSTTTDEENPQEGVFCHQCGKKGAPGDIFCRACGTKLR